MRVVLYGATGMVGQGALRACLADPDVSDVLVVGRTPLAMSDPKLHELVLPDLFDYSKVEAELRGFDACLFCLGVSSAGMDEAAYTRITYDLTVAAAQALVKLNPSMTMVFISGQSTDSTEKGRVMWARVKGRAENALLAMPFKAAYMFRPGIIEPLDGIVSKTRAYRMAYVVMRPFMPLMRALMPNKLLTTRQLGEAMLAAAKRGAAKRVLEVADIRALVHP